MRINLKVRMKNPWFWIGIVGIILTATGISPAMLTSWGILWDNLKELVQNPFLLGSAALSILSVFVDPTTAGLSDSSQAMSYTEPKKDK